MAIDPICDMTVDESTQLRVLHAGVTHYFCCDHCRRKFMADPLQAVRAAAERQARKPAKPERSQVAGGLVSLGLGPPPAVQELVSATAMSEMQAELPPGAGGKSSGYFCPMCPEVHSDVPTACPKCGMALEPISVTEGPEDTTELVSLTRRFRVAVIATVPVFLMAMLPMMSGWWGEHAGQSQGGSGTWFNWFQGDVGRWLQAILSGVVLFGAGWPLLWRGLQSIYSRYWNMFTLIAMGTMAAYGFSCVSLLWPNVIPQSLSEHGMSPIYFESAAVIMTLVLLGQVLELHSRRRTGDAIRELIALAPTIAHRVTLGEGEEIATELDVVLSEVRVGDLLQVRPGEKVPVDGVVVVGRSEVSEALVTGESMPVSKRVGDSVIGGTLNESGMMIMRAAHVGQETMLARIVQLVAQAQRSRAPIQRLTDLVAGWFVPLVVAFSLLTLMGWLWWGGAQAWTLALVNSVAVLIIACPCALGLATPMSIMVGVGVGARQGVLIRSAEVIEELSQVDLVLFDKTGTLTMGKPAVVAIHPVAGVSEADVIEWAAAVEQPSEHPLARAITECARERRTVRRGVSGFQSLAGFGAEARGEGRLIRVGKLEFVSGKTDGVGGDRGDRLVRGERNSSGDVAEAALTEWKAKEQAAHSLGQTVIYVGMDYQPLGMIVVADQVKANAREALEGLRRAGLELVMVTGDSEITAKSIAERVGIDDVHAGLLPQDKIDVVRKYRESGRRVVMVGDGVNDAPALAAAQVGMALGTGSDVAIESAGVTLLGGDLGGVLKAIELGRRVMRNVKQNLFFAFFYNLLGIPLAAGVLEPVFGVVLNPMIAALAMSFSSVSVIGNALRLQISRGAR